MRGDHALLETQHAFDGVAPTYAGSNADNPTLCWMRRRTRAALDGRVPAGSRLLDLGCGPGEDAAWFAARGHAVTAIDWSPAMVEEATRRVGRAGLTRSVDVHHLGIHEIGRLPAAAFDAVYSSFGPLNCVSDLRAAAALVAARLRTGGLLVASVIGRVCPMEMALYASRGEWARLRMRFAREAVPVALDGGTVWTRYYTPGEFSRACAPAGLERVLLQALGLFVPPPYMDAFAGRHPALVHGLARVEERVAGWPGVRMLGDHFLIALRKR